MALSTQQLVDSFAAKVVSRLAFLTKGADKSAQLEGKQTDKKIRLRVIDPCGTVGEDKTSVGSNSEAVTFNTLSEKTVEFDLIHYWSGVAASIVDEAAEMNDAQLQQHLNKEAEAVAAKILKSAVADMLYVPNKAFVGGWEDLNAASGDLGSTFEGKIYGFINYKARAKLATSQPFGSAVGEKLYKASEIGPGPDGSEYFGDRYMPTVVIGATEAGATLTVSAIATSDNKLSEIKLAANSSCTIKAGTPITLVGLKACDGLGNVTDEDAVVIAKEDISLTSTAASIKTKIDLPVVSGVGRQIADEDGTDLVSGDCISATIPAAGTYFAGMLRCDGFVANGSVEKLAGKGCEHSIATVDGINVHVNAVSTTGNVDMVDNYRFDVYFARGVVDPRGTAYILIKK